MIVRDNEETLEPCLASIRPWVDEMVVVDTGSLDNTPKIAEAFGARVFHFEWCDSFSAARNESLRHARGEWLFWMDSDDTIDAENGRKLRELAYGPHQPRTLGYVMQVHCPAQEGDADSGLTVVDHVKMFPDDPQIRFEFRIHEQVLPSIRRLGGNVAWTDVFVVHSGSDHSPEGLQRKYDRDLRILNLEIEEKPDHPFVLFNLGMTHTYMERYDLAVRFLQRCLQVSDPSETHVRKAYALLVSSFQSQNQVHEAWKTCREGQRALPDDVELLFRQGMVAHATGRLEDAEQAYRAALADREERHFTSIDPGIVGYKGRNNLAAVYRDMGRDDLAEAQWRHVVAEAPDFREGQRSLGKTLIRQRKYVSAELQIDRMLREGALRCDAMVLKGELLQATGDVPAATGELEDAVREFPDDMEAHQALCKCLFGHSDLKRAERAFQQLIEFSPEDGAAHRNLGILYLRAGNHEDAVHSLRESVRLRPESVATWQELAGALEAMGKADEASNARRQARASQTPTAAQPSGMLEEDEIN